ncbi:shiftless antiviral inhibitor of ribosomal frameshifting protein homolog isoform X2 [Saccostrea cucullata]|uniref:shiftless antiviral inhibitor of ribosomal frameshifting protein homolog isoform X1 n=1 Tax=Saccostrea cuccullata TaxID=36930 RepID=UPI002ED5E672
MGDDDKLEMITRVRELFHGRFNREEVRRLLDNHNWNQAETVDFVFTNEPSVVTQLIAGKSEKDIVGLQESELLRLNAEKGKIPSRRRQFACEACDNVWWKRVPKRKPVSKCNKCLRKFDPVPEDEEYGWAGFTCSCGNEFSGYGQKNVTTSKCYKCSSMALATSVRPPEARKDRKSRSRHSCSAPDCTHRQTGSEPRGAEYQNTGYRGRGGRSQRGAGYANPYAEYNGQGYYNSGHGVVLYERNGMPAQQESHSPSTCVHPESRQSSGKKRVIVPSMPHRSSGSTVDSLMLDDDEASSVLSGYQPSVDNIPEVSDEENEQGDE